MTTFANANMSIDASGGRMRQATYSPDVILRDELYALHASFCQALSDPKRLLIVSALRDGERSVGELCAS
jgi:hypothetical protein